MNHDEIHVKVAKLLNTLDCQTTYCTTSNINGFISSRLSINSNKLIPCETKIPFKRIVYIIRLIKTTSNVLNSLARIMFHLSGSIYNCNGSQTNVSPVYVYIFQKKKKRKRKLKIIIETVSFLKRKFDIWKFTSRDNKYLFKI